MESATVIGTLLLNAQVRQPVCPWRAQEAQARTRVPLADFRSRRERWPQQRHVRLPEPLAGSPLARQSAIPFRPREARRCLPRAQYTHARARTTATPPPPVLCPPAAARQATT